MDDATSSSRPLRYLALNCTLKPSGEASSTDVLLEDITRRLDAEGARGATRRAVDHHLAFGVSADEGDGDGWPELRAEVLAADLFVLGTPIWLGHPASVSQVVLERLDAFLGETDDRDQITTVDRVAMVAVVGNEDGAHHVGAELFQGLNDVGFALAPGAMTYWVGEAMGSTDLKDLDDMPASTSWTTATMVANAVHLARLLQRDPFPALGSS